jgi:AraC-like DNA-binding protein
LLYYVQDNAFKYNLHVAEHGADLPKLATDSRVFYDPLGIHPNFHLLVFIHLLVYAILLGIVIVRKYHQTGMTFFTRKDSFIHQYRNLFFFYLLAILIMAYLVFKYFWLGDFLFSLYLTAIIYLIGISISFRSLNQYFRHQKEVKYASSSLGSEDKASILKRIKQAMEEEEFYCRDGASLEELSKRTKVSKHYVSQVINELLHKSFFEYLAELRIEKSRSLLADPRYHKITIDEISFMVGYNSRSAFNRVFKSMTGTTPAEYRKQISG